jgi:hypothetical protein
VFFIYVCCGIANMLLSGVTESGGHWYRSREAFVEDYGKRAVFLLSLHAGAALAYVFCALRYWLTSARSVATFFLLMAPVCALDLYMRGNRLLVFQTLIVGGILCHQKRDFRTAVLVLALSIPGIWFFTVFRHFRAQLYDINSVASLVDTVGNANRWRADANAAEMILAASESMGFLSYVEVVRQHGFSQWGSLPQLTFLRTLLMPVPKRLLPNKPPPVSVLVGHNILDCNTSVNPLLPGEALINLSYFGVPVAALLVVACMSAPLARLVRDPELRFAFSVVLIVTVFRQPFDTVFQAEMFAGLVLAAGSFLWKVAGPAFDLSSKARRTLAPY